MVKYQTIFHEKSVGQCGKRDGKDMSFLSFKRNIWCLDNPCIDHYNNLVAFFLANIHKISFSDSTHITFNIIINILVASVKCFFFLRINSMTLKILKMTSKKTKTEQNV